MREIKINNTQYPCACGDKKCIQGISFDGLRMWITDKNGNETIIYLDRNLAGELIKRLKEEMTNL